MMQAMFQDGPAATVFLTLGRLPLYLRVTEGPKGYDALDRLDDVPELFETIHAYKRGEVSTGMIDYTKGGKRVGERFALGTYRLVAEQPPVEVLHHNEAWRTWCMLQESKEEAASA
jgi:hypothetical protein